MKERVFLRQLARLYDMVSKQFVNTLHDLRNSFFLGVYQFDLLSSN